MITNDFIKRWWSILTRSTPKTNVVEHSFEDHSFKAECKRYSVAQLLEGASWKSLESLNRSATRVSEGTAIGAELI